MRFVIFNLAVLLALGYLLLGSPDKRPAWLAQPQPTAATVAPAPQPMPAAATEAELRTSLDTGAAPEPENEPIVAVAPPPPPPPPPPDEVVRDAAPTSPVQQVAVMPVAPVITEPAPSAVEPRTAPLTVLMTAQERRRELGRLADDMESVFLDKLAR